MCRVCAAVGGDGWSRTCVTVPSPRASVRAGGGLSPLSGAPWSRESSGSGRCVTHGSVALQTPGLQGCFALAFRGGPGSAARVMV